MSAYGQAKVQTLNQITLMDDEVQGSARSTAKELKQSNLLAYRPEKDQDSLLLNDLQISELCSTMSGLYKIA